MIIKLPKKTQPTFGDFIALAYQKWGAARAANMVQLAINARQVMFRKQPPYLNFFRQKSIANNEARGVIGRNKIGTRLALLAVLLGMASFVNGAYSRQVFVPAPRVEVVVPAPPIFVAPPIIVAPDPGFFLFGGGYGGRFDDRHDAHDYGRRGFESRGRAHPDRGGRRR